MVPVDRSGVPEEPRSSTDANLVSTVSISASATAPCSWEESLGDTDSGAGRGVNEAGIDAMIVHQRTRKARPQKFESAHPPQLHRIPLNPTPNRPPSHQSGRHRPSGSSSVPPSEQSAVPRPAIGTPPERTHAASHRPIWAPAKGYDSPNFPRFGPISR